MKNNAITNGKWIIKFNPEEFNYKQVLEKLVDIRDPIDENPLHTPYKQMVLKKNSCGESFHFEQINDIILNTRPIKNILLAHPLLMSDKRWESIHLTTASLFLGSALSAANFNVSSRKLNMPMTAIDDSIIAFDLLGFTLFEDLFKETRDFFDLLGKTSYNILLAAGGPMITLNPLESAWHLPELNLLVRGEGEFVLQKLLKAINNNDLNALLKSKGFLFQSQGTIIISDLNHINRPGDFTGFQFNLDFLDKKHLKKGLEINLSRGCHRGCIFCSRVQGKFLRKLPEETFDELLTGFSSKIKRIGATLPYIRTININDDDILQDIDYAKNIFQIIKKHNFKLWGIQTSVNSFFKSDLTIDYNILATIDDKTLYVDNNPLIWIGTDAFLKKRGKRLGKRIPSEQQILQLMQGFEERKIRNYHYWISSDHNSDWEEFSSEFLFIYRLNESFKTFGLLAHSPFLVPYSTTPLYQILLKSKDLSKQVKYKNILKARKEIFQFPLVERVDTRYSHLNRLLKNEKLNNRMGFFDYLRGNDYLNAFITIHNYLKQERLSFESLYNPEAERLIKTEKEIEEFISTII